MRAGTPRRLPTEEVSGLVGTFSQAFADARRAGFDQESRAIFYRAPTVAIITGVKRGVHELIEQIAVSCMDFHAVVANPDLTERLQHGWPLAEADRSSFYTRRGETGYTDFPVHAVQRGEPVKA